MTKLKIGVFAIIFNKQNKVLLCRRRDYDLWNLPGGGPEINESPWQGVIREVKEETNLKVKVNRLSGLYFKPKKQELVLSFICTAIGGKIKLTPEADQIEYFNIKKLPPNISPKQVERIKDALLNKNKVLLKTQTGPSSIQLLKLKKKE